MNGGRVPHLDCLHSVALLVEARSWKSCVRVRRTHFSLPVLSHAAAVTVESPPAGCCTLRLKNNNENEQSSDEKSKISIIWRIIKIYRAVGKGPERHAAFGMFTETSSSMYSDHLVQQVAECIF